MLNRPEIIVSRPSLYAHTAELTQRKQRMMGKKPSFLPGKNHKENTMR